MPYEIEFLPVGAGEKSGDAILVRYKEGDAFKVVLVDGGYLETGEEICSHVRKWYGTERIDYVIGTHPDTDHMSGLRPVLEQMEVGQLWMHAPHVHAAEILPLFKSRNWTVDGLKQRLYDEYPIVSELLETAGNRRVPVYEPFAGAAIGPFTVLSPTRAAYEGLLPQFRNTPAPDPDLLRSLGALIEGVGRRVAKAIHYSVAENWGTETLAPGGTTSAENESSVVLYGDLGHGGILLTADAGIKALTQAAAFAATRGWQLGSTLDFVQVPHHGSRNNVSPGVLNRLIGPPVAEGTAHKAVCFISAGRDDPAHPRLVVTNALTRRGLRPMVQRGNSMRHYRGIGPRDGWTAKVPIPFSNSVEAYE